MDIDRDRIDDAVLALLFLGRHDAVRTWKSFDWAAMERLIKRGSFQTPLAKLNPSYSLTKVCDSPRHCSGSCSQLDAKVKALLLYPAYLLRTLADPAASFDYPIRQNEFSFSLVLVQTGSVPKGIEFFLDRPADVPTARSNKSWFRKS